MPFSRIEPLTRAPSGSNPISASAVMRLPQRDSPIKPERAATRQAEGHAAQRVGRAGGGLQGDAEVLNVEQVHCMTVAQRMGSLRHSAPGRALLWLL